MGYTVTALRLDRDDPDRAASLADLRTASCLADGIAISDIDPAGGYEITEWAYLRSRASWAHYLGAYGMSIYVRPGYDRDRAYWERMRPQFLAAHPWPPAE